MLKRVRETHHISANALKFCVKQDIRTSREAEKGPKAGVSSRHAAPSTVAFDGNSPLGVRQGWRTLPEGQEAPSGNPRRKQRRAGSKRHPGRLFFADFLLATQKKVSRLSVREPTLKWLRGAYLCLMDR